MIQEDKADWDAIIQAAKDEGATDEMIKELGSYQRENNVYDDMAQWVKCVHVMLNDGVCLFVFIRKIYKWVTGTADHNYIYNRLFFFAAGAFIVD